MQRLILTVTLTTLLISSGCGGSTALREPDEFAGCATDELWRIFDTAVKNQSVVTSDAQASVLAPPLVDGAALDSANPPTFSWSLSSTSSGNANGTAVCTACPTCGITGLRHEAPVSGDAFDLRFEQGTSIFHRVLTTEQRWTPPARLWSSWKSRSLNLVLVRMHVEDGALTAGPYQASQALGFRVN